MSLDGFIASPDDSVAAFSEKFTEPSALADEIIKTTGVFMVGGRVFRPDDVGQIYGGAWEGAVSCTVCSHRRFGRGSTLPRRRV